MHFVVALMCLLLNGYASAEPLERITGTKKRLYVGGAVHGGFLMLHTSKMSHLRNAHSAGNEVWVHWRTTGSKTWHDKLNRPVLGIHVMAITLGNSEVLGNGFSLSMYGRFPIYRTSRLSFEFRAGAGIGYLTKAFHHQTNYKNVAIASHLNGSMQLGMDVTYHLNKRFDITSGWRFSHFSNGAMKMPNLGVNYPTLYLGAAYAFVNLREQASPLKKINTGCPCEKGGKPWLFEGVFTAGMREIYPVMGPKYPAFNLLLNAIRFSEKGHSLLLGVDWVSNASDKRILEGKEMESGNALRRLKAGVSVGYGLYLGSLMILIQKGAYVLNYGNTQGVFYHRVGVRQSFGKHLVGQLTLKTHFFNADFIEIGIGYRL